MNAIVIAISQGKGGSCKTTTAVNLSGALIEKGLKVILADMDRDKPDAMQWQNNGDSISWVKLVKDENPMDEIKELKKKCDILILDTSPNYSTLALKAVMLSDFVIIPTGASEMDQDNAKNAVSVPLMAQKPFKVLMSNIRKGTKFSKNLDCSETPDEIKFNSYITNRAVVAESYSKGMWVGDLNKGGDNHFQYLNLADEVLNWIGLTKKNIKNRAKEECEV